MAVDDVLALDRQTAGRVVAPAVTGFDVRDVVPLRGGWNSVFEVRSEDGRSVVVKAYTDEWRWKMEKEAFVYEVLRRHAVDVPVPALLVADDSKTVLRQAYLLVTRLPGETMFALLDRLTEAELESVYRQVGGILGALHAVTFEAFGYVGTAGVVDAHATNADYMRFQFDKKLRELDELGGDGALRRRVERHVRERAELLECCPRPCFCHNDCHEGNLLVVAGEPGWRVSGLLDFENVVAGDPLLDLAKTHYYARRGSEATLAAVAEGQGGLREGWRDTLQLYALYHALELWGWFAALGRREALAGIADDMRRFCEGGL